MFSRVAACIAACLVAMPAVSNGETAASADAAAPLATVVMLTPGKIQYLVPGRQTDEQAKDRAGDPTQDRMQNPSAIQADGGSHAGERLAALDPAEPFAAPPANAEPTLAPPALAQPFGRSVVPVLGGNLLAKWSGVEADIRDESAVLARCRANPDTCPFPARNFLAIVAEGRALTGRARLGVINRAVNMAVRPVSDLEQWGVIDRWSAPLDTFTTRAGDCEDYAIAKYVALTEAGVAAADVRLVIVRNLEVNEDHAVVAVRLDGDWIILDNRWLMMVEDNRMRDVVPLFTLDQTGVWAFMPGAVPVASRASPASLLQ